MRRISLAVVGLFITRSVIAEHGPVEEVIVEAQNTNPDSLIITTNFEAAPIDSAGLLRTLPGANVNSNGPVSGIVQYRGLFGDRVNVHIGQVPALTGGPNAMDAPLSYTPPLLLKQVELQRGLASVSAGQETLGGHLSVELDRGDFATSDETSFNGEITSRFNGNTDGGSHAIKTSLADNHHKVAVLASHDEGDDTRIGGGDTLAGTEYRRTRYDLSYGWQNADNNLEVFVGELDTRNTGTPALPMDIVFIETDLAGISGSTRLGNATVSGHLSYSYVDHEMDNFSQRLAPANMMQFRSSDATAKGYSWSLKSLWPLDNGSISVGTDGNISVHDSDITNPNNALFAIHNFNDVERDVYGLFTEWKSQVNNWSVESGLRYNRVEMDADPVGASGLMGIMGANVALLAGRFNAANRSQNDDNVDVVVKASTDLSDSLNFQLGLGIKNRAPSYQERYLWLPLQATAGLADGRSYIGGLDLDSETSHEINVGLNWVGDNGWLSPQLFYRRIDDYIQGVPATDITANMISMMMSGQPALMFDNIDAKMVGLDMAYGYRLSDHLSLEGNLSYVQGENRDNDDYLYRIAPLNNRLALIYQEHGFKLSAESLLYAQQNKVADFNDEEESSGYGIFNINASFELVNNLAVSTGVSNLFNKRYQDHLAGVNRNGDSDIAVGERLIGAGRNAYLAVTLSW